MHGENQIWHKKAPFVNRSTGAHRTRVQERLHLSLKNGVKHLGLCAENMCDKRSCFVIYFSFSAGSIFGAFFLLGIDPTQSTLGIVALNTSRGALGYLEPARLERKENKVFSSCGNAWPLLTFLKACGWWGHVFATSVSPINRSWTKKLAMSPSSTVCHPLPPFMAVSMILNMWHWSSYCICGIRGSAQFFFFFFAWTSLY